MPTGIELKGASFTYLPGTPMARKVLSGIDLSLRDEEVLCLMGKTGAGKSTLLQIMGGLMPPTGGEISVDGRRARGTRALQSVLREAVGTLFQSPERQLFADTVERDVAFGPRNRGVSGKELSDRVEEALHAAGLDPGAYRLRSPFHLSQGEMRRVALAGVLAMRPRFLLLDEPSSGLDHPGRESLYASLRALREKGRGILLVTHDWEEVEILADRVALLSEGGISICDKKREVLTSHELITGAGLEPPPLVDVLSGLRRAGVDLPVYATSPEETAELIATALRGEPE
ncbi:MAG: ATP-binding cassette domain-containing protein [Actinomycetota bacterium]|nr:ATP-binding cassette domain-containing protein [Actinomycetota bacterium]